MYKTVRAVGAALVVALLAFIPMPASARSGTAPSTAAGWTQLFADKNDMVWSGGDQVTSFKQNGFTYWLFGDSMVSNGVDPDGSYPDGTIMVSNRILLQQGDQMVNAIDGAGTGDAGNGVLDPSTHTDQNQKRYWTQGMFAANGHLYVLLQHVESDGNGDFKWRGAELAKFAQGSDGKLTFKSMIATPSTGVDQGAGPLHIQWSGDAIVSGGYVYFYGATMAQGNPYVAHFSYVARVPTAQVENPRAWKFYAKTSNTWKVLLKNLDQNSTDQADAILAGQVSSVRLVGNKYVMLHKPWNGWGSDVKAVTSSTPFGPWSQEATLFSSPAGTTANGQNYMTYSPQLHTTQTLGGAEAGKILVSIAYNGSTLSDTIQDADLYKPRFYAISPAQLP